MFSKILQSSLLPFGRLRDLPSQLGRADTVIITKSPPYLCAEEKRAAIAANHIGEGQHIEDKSPEGLYDIQ